MPIGAPMRQLFWLRSSWLPDGCERVEVSDSGGRSFYSEHLRLSTGTTSGSLSRLEKDWISGFASWSKRRVVSFMIGFLNIAYARVRVWSGAYFKGTGAPSFGVYVDNNSPNTTATLYGFSWDGSSGTDISLGTVTEDNVYLITIEFTPGQSVKFYVNGSLVGTVTSNLPPTTTAAYAWGAFRAEIYNYSASDLWLTIYQVACTQEL